MHLIQSAFGLIEMETVIQLHLKFEKRHSNLPLQIEQSQLQLFQDVLQDRFSTT